MYICFISIGSLNENEGISSNWTRIRNLTLSRLKGSNLTPCNYGNFTKALFGNKHYILLTELKLDCALIGLNFNP